MSRALLLVLAALLAAGAASAETLRIFREEALAHAQALEAAYRRLEDHVLRRSAAATSWTGSIPPASVGWLDVWTERGLRARYCGDALLVYFAPARLKGVGLDQRAVRAAPWTHAPRTQRAPALHWLDGSVARGGVGRDDAALPACLSGARFGGALPTGRAARAGRVEDPWAPAHRGRRVRFETRVQACPAGFHASHAGAPGETVGRRRMREVRQTVNGRGEAIGAPSFGAWRTIADNCRADYAVEETGTQPCPVPAGWQGSAAAADLPQRIRRRRGTVTAAGTSWGAWRVVEDNCWTATAAVDPKATVTEAAGSRETREIPCPAGWSGAAGLEVRTGPGTRTISFSFGGRSVQAIPPTAWATVRAADCSPPPPEDDDESGAMGGPGGVDAGYDYDTGEQDGFDSGDSGDGGGDDSGDSGDDAGQGGEDV